MKPALMTWASGDHFCRLDYFKVFLNSYQKLKPDFPAFILTDGDDANHAVDRGFTIYKIKNVVKHILSDRWLAFYKFLCDDTNDFDYVLICDCKDVILQENPFELAKYRKSIQFVSEGVTHKGSEWNAIDQTKFQLKCDKTMDFFNWSVINGGFMMGPRDEMRNFCLTVYTAMMGKNNCTDQAAINYIFRLMNAETAPCSLCLTGETVKNSNNSFVPELKNGKIIRPEIGYNSTFCAFHQWERTLFRDPLMELYL